MQTLTDLRAQRDTHTRGAKNILAEKGSARWTPGEQANFDNLIDQAEAAQERINLLQASQDPTGPYSEHHREGLAIYMRKNHRDMSDLDRRKVNNAMSTTTGSEGGYSVGTKVASDLISLLKGFGFMRQVAQRTTTQTGEALSYPTSDGTTEGGELLVQNAAATNQDATFGTAPIPVYRFSSKVITVPWELLQDSQTDIVSFVMQRIRDRIGRAQNPYFTTGTGSSQPNGLVTASAVGRQGTTGQTLTVIYDDLAALIDSVDVAHQGVPGGGPDGSDAAAGWMFSQAMRRIIRTIKDAAGRPVWEPGAGGSRPQLLDFPVYINNDMPVSAASAKTIAFGNLNSYMIRDAMDVSLYRFDDSVFATKGQVGFLGIARAGGNLLDSGAVKLFQHSAT